MGSPKLSAEAMLLRDYLDQRHWRLETNLPHWLMVKVPEWKDVQFLVDNFKGVLCGWGAIAPVYFQYEKRYLVQLSKEGSFMDIAIAGVKANRALLDVFGMMLNSPERSLSLVHANSLRQFVVNGGQNGRFCLSVDPGEASRWKRSEYWLAESLEQFEIDWRRDWNPGTLWHEYTYLIDAQAPIEKRPVREPTHRLVTRYQLILGPNNEPFHLGENLEMVPLK